MEVCKFFLCISGLRNLRRKLRRHAIPSLHLPIINKERHETNEKHTDIDIKVSESIQSTTETGKAAYNAETKQKYENNVLEPMEKDIKVFERVQSTNVHQITHQDNLQMDNKQKSNNVACESSLYLQQPSVTGKSYKLLIQIDKVRARPGPKSKKRQLMTITTNHYKQLTQCQKIEKKDLNESIKKDDIIINLDTDSSCNSPEKNSTAIQDDVSIEKNLQCSICQKFFDSNRTLFMHKKTHMFCQYCGKQFDRKLLFDYHEKLHFSTDPTLPYKCHLCPTKFSDKQAIKVHNELFHTSQSKIKGDKSMVLLDNSFSEKFAVKQLKYQCEICKVFMKNEDSLRSHRASHEGEIKIPNGDITHKMNSKSNHERNTKYLCKVCCKEFETPAEAEAHTYTHVEIIETEHKCNICKKTFNSRQMLSDHLAHHLSHAYHCVVCRKAFINRTTLKIHMRTHKNIK
ncbi:hypothetical protein PV327_001439 [Microctonus hyperodae]|uniref:C2H2-type domain-containing protein n=1 Tax=Microctonus hyperodae TaxID=165561 RepID=A0AA39G8N6_MICHY|nr:hypothetical protein PV327_001439 [Microctonus hyperodae]